jgi:hypothetical protein
MAERGFYDPKQPFPQTNAQDLIGYREFYDLEYAMPKSREEGVALSLASNGVEVEWFARDMLKVGTGDALKILNDEYLEIRDRYPGEFALMADTHALEGDCRPIVEDMIRKGMSDPIEPTWTGTCKNRNVLTRRRGPEPAARKRSPASLYNLCSPLRRYGLGSRCAGLAAP